MSFPRNFPRSLLSQESPRSPPGVSQASPRRLPGVSQESPTGLPGISQASPRCLPGISQQSPSSLPAVFQRFPNSFSGVSQAPPEPRKRSRPARIEDSLKNAPLLTKSFTFVSEVQPSHTYGMSCTPLSSRLLGFKICVLARRGEYFAEK